MALKLIRKPLEVLTGTTGTGTGLLTVTGSWGTYFIAPNNGVDHVAVTGDVEQICVWVRDTGGLNIQTFRARRGAESMEQCALNVMVPLTKGQRWFVQAEGQGKVVTVMHDFKPIPPPCVNAFWRVLLGGGRYGAETHQTRHRRVPSAGTAYSPGERHHLGVLGKWPNLPTSGHLLGRGNTRNKRRETRHRNSEVDYPAGGVVRGRRPLTGAVHAGRASNPRDPHLETTGGGGA